MKLLSCKSGMNDSDDAPLTKAQASELRRRLKDHDDPTRYVIVSPFSRRFCLYYVPADGVFIMNEIPDSCLFKRKTEALAVAKLVAGRRKKRRARSLQVIAIRKTKTGVRILQDVSDPWHPKQHWRPVLRRHARKG